MMGLGYLGNGGSSSSSSNLSPLAPPFTVDRSNQKPNSNPLGNFTEAPHFGSSSAHNWQYSLHPPGGSAPSDFFPNRGSELDSIQTTSLPSPNGFGYEVSDPINPANTHWAPLNPSSKPLTDSFSYLGESKPYYPPYVSPIVNNNSPLLGLNEPSYDILSTPMDGFSRVDYTQSLSGLDYTPPWGGFWDGLTEGKRGKRIEVGGGLCQEGLNVSGSLVYNNHTKRESGTAESFNKCIEDSEMSHGKYSFLRENHAGSSITGQLDEKTFSVQNPSKTAISGTGSVFPETYMQATSLEPAANTWNHQSSYGPFEKRFQPFVSGVNDCITVTKSSSPSLVIRPPTIDLTSSASLSARAVDICNIRVNTKDVDNHISLDEKAPHLLPSSEVKEDCMNRNRFSSTTGKIDHMFIASPPTKEEILNKQLTTNSLNYMSKARAEFQIPDINIPDVFTTAFDSSLDSPCWKGAPAANCSPFERFASEMPQHLLKKLEVCDCLNLQGTHSCPLCNDSVKDSSQDSCDNCFQNESVCVDNGSSHSPRITLDVHFPAKEHKLSDVTVGLDCVKPSSRGKSSNGIDKSQKACAVPSESKNDSESKPPNVNQQNPENGCFTSKKLKLGTEVVESGNTNDALKDSFVPSFTVESISCFPSSGDETAKPRNHYETKSTPNTSVQILVNTMHNLSELLVLHCLNDASALHNQDHEALKHVTSNLNACMSRKTVNVSSPEDSKFSLQGAFYELGESRGIQKGASAARPRVTKEVTAQSSGEKNIRCMADGKNNYDVSAKKVQKILDLVSSRDDADSPKDHIMVHAIKKVLDENFQCEEEIQAEDLLFKNLWLEAEAELCSVSYRARFNRVKSEMDKCNLDETKDVSESVEAEELSSFKVSPAPSIPHMLTPKTKDNNEIAYTSVQDPPISSSTTHVDDAEASVMSRFHILKFRGENSNPIDVKYQQLPEVAMELKSPIFSSPNHVDDVEASVMSRYHILKCRAENSNPIDVKDQQLLEADMEFKSPICSSTSHVDDVEASVISRLHILKCRDENSNPINVKDQQLPVFDTGFSSINCRLNTGHQAENKRFDVAVGSGLHHRIVNDSEERFVPFMDDLVTDNPVIQSFRSNKLQNQMASGWYDNSSSDWEHVLKDEFA